MKARKIFMLGVSTLAMFMLCGGPSWAQQEALQKRPKSDGPHVMDPRVPPGEDEPRGPGGPGDNRDDARSGKMDRPGDGNSGQGDDMARRAPRENGGRPQRDRTRPPRGSRGGEDRDRGHGNNPGGHDRDNPGRGSLRGSPRR